MANFKKTFYCLIKQSSDTCLLYKKQWEHSTDRIKQNNWQHMQWAGTRGTMVMSMKQMLGDKRAYLVSENVPEQSADTSLKAEDCLVGWSSQIQYAVVQSCILVDTDVQTLWILQQWNIVNKGIISMFTVKMESYTPQLPGKLYATSVTKLKLLHCVQEWPAT